LNIWLLQEEEAAVPAAQVIGLAEEEEQEVLNRVLMLLFRVRRIPLL
jgi:hypothetical protein